MMHDWRKYRELSRRDRWLLLRATIALPMVAVLVRWLGVGRCQNFLTWLVPLRDVPAMDHVASLATARAIARLVRVAATRGLYSANCLERSLVLWWLLRCLGLTGEIRYGAHTADRGFAAHAWVEYVNQVIGDRSDIGQQFVPFEPAIPRGNVPERILLR